MVKFSCMLPLDIYHEHLEFLNGIRFTPREVDIIACILNGRSAKTIPALLSIAPKTVAAHMENIRSKAGCSSRESIIDFIERSEKYVFIKNEYYLCLLNHNSFEKCLREFSKIILPRESACSLIYAQDHTIKVSIFHHLKQHLVLAGVRVDIKIKKTHKSLKNIIEEIYFQYDGHIIYLLEDAENITEINLDFAEKTILNRKIEFSLENLIFINTNELNKNKKRSAKIQFVDFSEQKNYYLSFFEILKIIYPQENLDKILNAFRQQTDFCHIARKDSNIYVPESSLSRNEKNFCKKFSSYVFPLFLLNKSIYFLISIVIFSVFSFNYIYSFHEIKTEKEHKNTNIKDTHSIRSDLAIPTASSFLNRSEIISQIDNKLTGAEGIKSLAIVGIGGAGKTILARQYAQQQKANVVWEMNAETRGDLNTSFEKLASALSKTDKERREIRAAQEITNPKEREEKIIQFVKTHLKEISHWFLIFDNVEKFSEIQKYFPQDTQTWGIGKVILTTRDHNIQNSSTINDYIFIGELSKEDKLNLFSKIMNSNAVRPFTDAQAEEANHFLDNISPFPLDISVAAYYLKSTNSSYNEYLKNIDSYKEIFEQFQGKIIKENGSYNKTRYGIITLSLKKIIAESKDFSDLFLFISLLNAQDIPKELLEKYKNPLVVDSFIYHLKKYSLLMNTSLSSASLPSSLSLHHSTQNIALPYLIQHLAVNTESPLLKKISSTLDDYLDQVIEQEDFAKLKMMRGHLEKFLDHSNLLTNLSKGLLGSKLGSIHYFINDERTRQTLKDSLEMLKKENLDKASPADNSRIARGLLHIGAVYTELRLYKEAEQVIEKAVDIYGKKGLSNYVQLPWALTHLGNVHRRIGNYEKAKDYLEKSASLNKQYDVDKERIARNLAYLGSVYKGLGFYQKSRSTLEESLALHKEIYSNDHYRLGWILLRLGSMYRRLGDYEASLKYLHQSLEIHQKHFDENHIRIGWVLFHLASTYKCMGNYTEALKFCDKILAIYAKYSGVENIESARILRDMAKIYLEKNKLDDAENLAKKSLKILQDHGHTDAFKSYETLGEIYLKKSQSLQLKDPQETISLKEKAIDQFKQGLKIAEEQFSKDSIHIVNILSKIRKTQEEKF